MSVPAAAFKSWAARAGLPENTGALARAIAVGRPTLQAQYVRGRVHEWVLVKAARSHHLDPVAALAAFEEYADAVPTTAPSLEEVLSQVTLDDALLELLRRHQPDRAAAAAALQRWADPPVVDGVRQWIDAIDTGTLRRDLGAQLRMASSNLSAQITSNKLTPHGIATAARLAGSSPATGLAVVGLLTLDEARWPAGARQRAVGGLSEAALLELIGARVSSAHRHARRRDADEAIATRIQDTLG